ncbi:MAG TPA: DUF4249 domain-containing protein [Chryseosolibacter sp.]
MTEVKYIRTISIFLLAAMVASCLPDPLEVKDIPKVKPEIVVSSQIIPNQGLLVLLTRTIGALDASNQSDPEELISQIAVTDADVFIEGADGVYQLDSLGDGLYGGIAIPFVAGEQYTLKVRSTTLGEVEATTTVLPQITFEDVDAKLYYNNFDDTLAEVSYTLNDPVVANYYMINVQEVEREDFVENLINPRAFTTLVDDKAFNGGTYNETFRVFPRDYQPGDTIAVSLSNISDEYYAFIKLRLDNRFSFVEFLGEPTNYPSNVIGGRGFFNLYLPDVRVFVLEE